MATKTPNLQLILPGLGEFTDRWNEPLNSNFEVIDEAIGAIDDEITAARGSQTNLNTRISVALNNDGTLKAVPEISKARNSTIYGADDGVTDFDLDRRIELGDIEAFNARMGLTSLIDSLAFAGNDDVSDSVLSAASNYITYTGANVKVDGQTQPVVANINGYRQVIRVQKQVTISGSPGSYYITMDRSPTGELLLDRTGVGQDTGTVSLGPTTKLNKFSDSTQNFISLGVQPGDVIEVTTNGSPNKFTYVVASIFSATELLIIGRFESAQANLNYKITYPIGPSINFTATPHAAKFAPVSNKIYIAKVAFDGTNVTSITQYALKGRYEEFFSVNAAPTFEINAVHALGYFPRKLEVLASQANNYTANLEPLGTGVASGSGVNNDRNVITDISQTVIRAKNPTSGVFYKDYSGSAQTTGYLLIRAER